MFLGTDTEKVFGRPNWEFTFWVLQHVGLGDTMFNCITKIYSNPMAQVKANGVLSDPFSITNGTRQRCPFSPLLFALLLEPFLCWGAFNRRCRYTPMICSFSWLIHLYLFLIYSVNLTYMARRPTSTSLKQWGLIFPPTEFAIEFLIRMDRFLPLKYLGTYIPSKLSRTFCAQFPPTSQ